MTETRLTRSRPKNPPAKTVAEAEKVKGKVTNSNRKKERNVTIKTRLEDLPPLARKYVIENELKLTDAADRPVTPAEMGDLEGQLGDLRREGEADRRELRAERDQRIAGELDAKATSLMNADPSLDYGSAMKVAAASGEGFALSDEGSSRRMGEVHGTDEQMREAVERRMKADPANYPEEDEGEPVGSTHDTNDAEYRSEVRRIAKERGYDID